MKKGKGKGKGKGGGGSRKGNRYALGPYKFIRESGIPHKPGSMNRRAGKFLSIAKKKLGAKKALAKITWKKSPTLRKQFHQLKKYFTLKERSLYKECLKHPKSAKCTKLLRNSSQVLREVKARNKYELDAQKAIGKWNRETAEKVIVLDKSGKLTKGAGYIFRKSGQRWFLVKQRVTIGEVTENRGFRSPIKLSSVKPSDLSKVNERTLRQLTGEKSKLLTTLEFEGDVRWETTLTPVYAAIKKAELQYQNVMIRRADFVDGEVYYSEFQGFLGFKQDYYEVMAWFNSASHRKLAQQLDGKDVVLKGSAKAILDYNDELGINDEEIPYRFDKEDPRNPSEKWEKHDYREVEIEKSIIKIYGVKL